MAVKVLSAAAITSPAPVPSTPLSPLGIDISSTAAVSVPTLVTLALLPGSPVVTVPIVIVAAVPSFPGLPCSPLILCTDRRFRDVP